jgi:hypothetical protein
VWAYRTVVSLMAVVCAAASSGVAAAADKPVAASGSIGVRLVARPAEGAVNQRSRAYIVARLMPGASIRRQVEISNTTAAPAEVAVYSAAAMLPGGKFAFVGGRGGNDLSSWTSVSQRVLRLPAGTSAIETVTIKVPKSAPWGQRYAVVWAQVSAAGAAGGVTLVNRVGIRIYLSVGPGGSPRPDFAISDLAGKRSPGGDPFVVATVRNTGQSTLEIGGDLALSHGPAGLRTGSYAIRLPRPLRRDSSQTLMVRLDEQLPSGRWRVNLRLRSGTIERTATATINFPRLPPAGRRVEPNRLGPVVIALLIVLFAIAGLVLWHALRRRRDPHDPQPVGTPT